MLTPAPATARKKDAKVRNRPQKFAQDAGRAVSATADVGSRLLAWYGQHRRELPWRAPPGALQEPYRVWLSEIMLQQTTVPAVKSYYEKFLTLWPEFTALAAAPVDDVMKAWAGLGYYSRARNLHACAKAVVRDHGGALPDDETLLRKLPGIGAYTSAAIASIAFGKRAIVVDANVERVVSRLFEIREPLPRAKAIITEKTNLLTPQHHAGDFAQAMMDLGATICTSKNPSCLLCPLQTACSARANGTVEFYPLKAPKALKPQRFGAVFFLRRADGKVLMRTRPPTGLLGGMAEFPGSEWSAEFKLSQAKQHAPVAAQWKQLKGHVDHVFTHFALRLSVYMVEAPRSLRAPKGMRFVDENKIADEALPTLMRKVQAHVRR